MMGWLFKRWPRPAARLSVLDASGKSSPNYETHAPFNLDRQPRPKEARI